MATIHDRWNPSNKVSVSSTGELYVRGSGEGGAISVIENGDWARIIDDKSTANITYVCIAPPGTSETEAKWKIYIIDESAGYPVWKWADGDANFDNKASERTSLTYS